MAQNKNVFHLHEITKEYQLGFMSYDREFEMYQKPILKKGKNILKINGYDDSNFSDGNVISISPNNKFIVLDYISKGYVEHNNEKELYENYFCVIIDLIKHKVVAQLQSDCGGEWNNNNQFVSNGKIVF